MTTSLRALVVGCVAMASLGLTPIVPSRAQAPTFEAPPASPPDIVPPGVAPPDIAPASVVDIGTNAFDHVTVPVRVAGAGPFAFIVDTAATSSVVSRDLAAALRLAPAGKARMITLTGASEVMRVHVPDLAFVTGPARSIRAFALDEAHIGGQGILGIDVLRSRRVQLDFAAGTFEVSDAPRRWSEPDDPDTIVVTARRRLGQLILADSSIDGRKVDVIVDTGGQVSLGNEALRRLLLRRGGRYKTTPITLIGVTGGTLSADYTRVDRLRIGQVALVGMPVAFSDAYPFRRLKLRGPALLLGMDALRMFERVTLDFANRKAAFVLPEDVVSEERARMSGGAR